MGWFSRKVSLEKQLEQLAHCGVHLNPGFTEDDLMAFDDRAEMEANPYRGLVEALASDIEREPYTPTTNSLWLCDYERVEDHGAYVEILERLELMTGRALGLTSIEDFVDVEEGVAWVEFNRNGSRTRWDAEVDNDWMDPDVIVKYDALLKEVSGGLRIYSNHTDYGQAALFAAFDANQFKLFKKLSAIRMALIESQA